MSISNKAILASLKIRQWTARKQDSDAAESVEKNYSAESGSGNYIKRLLPESKELAKIQSVASETRKFFESQTLPWLSDGTRIVSSKNYFELVKAIRERKDAFELAVREFLAVYETSRIEASKKLGALYKSEEYRTMESLKRSYSFDLVFLPMPEVSDFRTEILDSEKNEFLAKMRDVESAAIRDCYKRLSKVVSNATERLSNPDAKFKDALIENIAQVCQLLPNLNIYQDAELEKTRVEVESLVSKISTDVLRENKSERESVAKKLAEIDSKLSAFTGKA